MKRIEPEYFIEQYSGVFIGIYNSSYNNIEYLSNSLKETESYEYIRTTAIFLIKPQTTSLAERMEARKRLEKEQQFIIQLHN